MILIDNKPSVYDCWTLDNAKHADIYDAIRYAAIRSMDMEEKKARSIGFDKLEKTLRKMGIFLTEIRQDAYNDYAEITCRVNPIDLYISLDEKDTNKWWDVPTMKKDSRPHPKKVIFSGPATTILWKDGTKTTVKCSNEDVWDDDVGIAMCYLKKLLGNKGNFNNIFREAAKVSDGCGWGFAKVNSSQVPESESYYSSSLDSMKRNIDEMADALNKALGGKK